MELSTMKHWNDYFGPTQKYVHALLSQGVPYEWAVTEGGLSPCYSLFQHTHHFMAPALPPTGVSQIGDAIAKLSTVMAEGNTGMVSTQGSQDPDQVLSEEEAAANVTAHLLCRVAHTEPQALIIWVTVPLY
uniref:Uncharacterized protein n=1 Tax=Sphaerodactylus townsendi TaxID=933632 RepID=A0ACB8GBM5_9SAUR